MQAISVLLRLCHRSNNLIRLARLTVSCRAPDVRNVLPAMGSELRLNKKGGGSTQNVERNRQSTLAPRSFQSRFFLTTKRLSAATSVGGLLQLRFIDSKHLISRQITWRSPGPFAPLGNSNDFVCGGTAELGRAGLSPRASRRTWLLAQVHASQTPRRAQEVPRCRDAALMHPGLRRPTKRRPSAVGSGKHGRRRVWTDQPSC
jgi:hypothetical protein